MADNAEKAQHLWRCSTQTIRKPRVACTIVWQPWAIKSATPTALKRLFHNMNYVISRQNTWQITPKNATPTALFHANHTQPQGSLRYRLTTLGYQKYNAYSVEKVVLSYDL